MLRTPKIQVFLGPSQWLSITRLFLGLAAADAGGACATYRGLPFRQPYDQTVAAERIGRSYVWRPRARIVMNLKQNWHTTETEI